ncbi:MAG: protein BatD [Deltaproteobacteria bacterium]|nr:protein BatD [Deltaproteobacteria bacterium]
MNLNLDRIEATLTDSIRVVVSISGSRNTQSEPVIKGLENFTVSPGGTSSRVEIINGKVTEGIDYIYYIQPKKTGTFRIGPAEVNTEGKTIQSNTETLTVEKPARSQGEKKGALFLNAEISATEVHVEEQAIYTLKLFRQARVRDISLSMPEMEHLVFKQLGKPREYQSVYNGQNYQVLEVRYVVIPSRVGSYAVGPSKMNMTVLHPGNRSSRNFFTFSTGRPMTLVSESLELNVFPLPTDGKPENFSGLVGNFTIESKLAPDTVKAGESTTLTVVVKGLGNVNRIPDLKFPELANAKVYTDQPTLEVAQGSKGIRGVKTMKWAVVPDKDETLEIPPIKISFFDTQIDQYKVLETTPHTISVLPEKQDQVFANKNLSENQEPREGSAKQEIKELGRDILPVHNAVRDLKPPFIIGPAGWIFWMVLLSPFFIYVTTFSLVKFRKQSVESAAVTQAKRASGNLVRLYQRGGHSSRDLSEAIRVYFNQRFNLSLGALTPDEAGEILKSKGVGTVTSEKVGVIVRKLEKAVYTGKGN